MNISTISELEIWMNDNGIKNTFTPNHRFVTDEGLGLEEIVGVFIWYYFERGEKTIVEFFKSESDAVNYIYKFLIYTNDN
jgi:hypothetical protein